MSDLRHDDLTIIQGSTWGISWPVVDDDDQPLDLTGWSVRAQVRPRTDSGTVLWEWSTAANSASVSGAAVTLRLTAAQSSAFTFSRAVYDIELTDGDGNVYRVAQGHVEVSPEVTR